MSAGSSNPAFVHGHTSGKFSPTYHSWAGMIQRCTNPRRPYFKRYGGRGIRVCDRWMTFTNFLTDMGERPKGLTLERINNDGHYELSNCCWASRSRQNRNTSQTVMVTINGVTKSMQDWCDVQGMSVETVRSRHKKQGWSWERAITTPRQMQPFRAR